MPSYDYKCNSCGNVQEELHPMKGPEEPIICNACTSDDMEKMVAIPYTKFVGDWQTNDVRGIIKE